jgi:hypothetical protein
MAMNVYESRLENTSSAGAARESAVLEYSDSDSESIVGVVMLLEQTTFEWAASGLELDTSRATREEPVVWSMPTGPMKVVEASVMVEMKELMTRAPAMPLYIEFRVDFFLVSLSFYFLFTFYLLSFANTS